MFAEQGKQCENCAAGKFSLPGSVNSSFCVCVPGKYGDKCYDCPKGKVTSTHSMPECVRCLPGKFSDIWTGKICNDCPPGYSNKVFGSKTVDDCTTCATSTKPAALRKTCAANITLCPIPAGVKQTQHVPPYSCPAGKFSKSKRRFLHSFILPHLSPRFPSSNVSLTHVFFFCCTQQKKNYVFFFLPRLSFRLFLGHLHANTCSSSAVK